jgi:opine dehydrogenase
MRSAAVLGGGNGSHAMAADLTLAGHEIRLFEMERYAAAMGKVFETKTIQITGLARTGTARLSCVTTDIREAIAGTEVIFIPLPAFTHRIYAELLADCVEDGQVIVLAPGTFGSLVFKRIFAEKKVTAEVTICELNSLTYDTRLTGPGAVHVYARNPGLKLGVLPASKTGDTYELISEFYEVVKADDVLDCGLHSLNPCLHVPGCILNAGRIERSKGEFYLYEEGITPCVARVMEAVEEERGAIVRKLGYRLTTLTEELAEGREARTVWEEVNGCETLEFIKGPTSIRSRYFTEDIPYGLVAWVELAGVLEIETPVMDALISLGSLIVGEDAFSMGRTKADMGIEGMTVEELREYARKPIC